MNIIQTSCDESDSKLIQRIDDDKIELMCCLNPVDFLDGALGRLGQVRSPFDIAFQEVSEEDTRIFTITLDGECLEIRNAKSLHFNLDAACPKLKVLRRDAPDSNQQNKEILTELKREFQPTIF